MRACNLIVLSVLTAIAGCGTGTRPQIGRVTDAVAQGRLLHARTARATISPTTLNGDRIKAESSALFQPDQPYPTLGQIEGMYQNAQSAAEPEPSAMPTSLGEALKADLAAMPGSLWEDTKRVYTDPNNLFVLLISGGASLAVRNTVDDTWEDHFDKHRSFRSGWGDLAGVVGNPGVHFAVAAAGYAYGVQRQDAKTYGVAKTLLNALIINDLTTMLLKVSANTESPNGENLAWPSGHTSSSFCLAAVMDEAYGPWVGVPLYMMAAFVGFERMDDREHHFSDVLFGAALGYVVGKSVAKGHHLEIAGGAVLPYADPQSGASGVAWTKSF